METNGISLFDQQPEPNKNNSSRTAFLLGGLAALTIAGALGAGFVIGGRSGNGTTAEAAAVASATRTLPGSPTASAPAPQSPTTGQSPSGGQAGGESAANSGDTSGGGDAPAPTNTTEAAAPTNTPESPAPTNTPVPPTSTPTNTAVPPTNTPTATATPPAIPCPWCPIFDPVIVFPVIDIFPPTFSSAHWSHCPGSYHFEFDVNEDSEMWVTYTRIGFEWSTDHQMGTSYDSDLAEGFFEPHDFVFHAVDSHGNEATMDPPFYFCW